MIQERKVVLQYQYIPISWAVVFLLTTYRFSMLWVSALPLHFDEAQYWIWAQSLDWGYFSKPPLIAWMIALWQYYFGEQVFVLKSLALCTHVVTTYLTYLIARGVYNREIGCYAALLFLTMPAISLSSLIISTDVFLLSLWAMALWAFMHAQDKKRLGYWVLAGIFCGLGLLTKYTMLLFFPSALLALYLRHGQRGIWQCRYGIVVASGTAVLIWAPNLWWNYTHKMVAFKHLYEISQIEHAHFHLTSVLAFLGAQIGVAGLVTCPLILRMGWRYSALAQKDKTLSTWIAFSAVFLIVISIQALISRAFANWAAPGYISLLIAVSATLVQHKQKQWLRYAIIVNLLTMGVMYHHAAIMQSLGIVRTEKNDPMRTLRAWPQLGSAVSIALAEQPHRVLLTEDRKMHTELVYYVHPHPFDAVLFNPKRVIKNHFQLQQFSKSYQGYDFLWVSHSAQVHQLQSYFNKITVDREVSILLYPGVEKKFYLYRLDGFKGYQS